MRKVLMTAIAGLTMLRPACDDRCSLVQAILSCSSPKSAMSLRVPPRAET
jgi:hypothetical protein